MPVQTVSLLGWSVHIIPQGRVEDYGQLLLAHLETNQGSQVITFNPEMAMAAQRDPEFAALLGQAEWLIPDGAGVVWAVRRLGIPVERCPGIELAAWLIAACAQRGWGVALIGATPEVNQQALAHWQTQYPTLPIGGQHGYFGPADLAGIQAYLQNFAPRLVLVGMGSPRQERWIQAQRGLLPQALWMGVGGSFDIWAGKKQRAPQWWRDHHLEWLYRLYQEPWRWRRMLALPHFAWAVLRQQE